MSEDIHNGDEEFKKAYGGFEEEPSAEVWKKINAELDRQDAIYYRRRSVAWKYIACLLVLLSAGVLAYYTYFDRPGDMYNTAGRQETISNGADTSSEASPERDHLLNKKAITEQAHSLPYGKANLSSDAWDSTGKNKNKVLGGSDLTRNQNAMADKPAHPGLNNSSSPETYTDIVQLHRDPASAVAGQQAITFHQKKPDVTKPVVTEQKQRISRYPAGQPGWVMRAAADVLSKQKDDSFSTTKSDAGRNNDSDLLTQNHQNHAVLSAGTSSASTQQPTSASIKIKPRFSPYWTITPFASADIMSYELNDDDRHRGRGNEPDDKGDIEERENHELSYTAGVMASLQYTSKTGFTTGLQYSHINIRINPQTLYTDRDNNQNLSYKFVTSSGYAFVDAKNGSQPGPGDSALSDGAEHNLEYLNVPLLVTYKFYNGKKLSIDAGAGIAAHFLLGSKVEAEVENANGVDEHITLRKLQGLRHQYFSFIANASLQWRINSRFSFTLLPSFKYAITPITKDNIVNTFPFGAGIGAGISYRL